MKPNFNLKVADLRQRLRLCATDHLELFMGWMAMVWGTWIMLPFSTFDSSPSTYSTMRWICNSEFAWGGFVATVGLCVWIAWALGTVRHRSWLAFTGAMVWLLLAAMFLIGDARSAGGAVYGSFCLASAVVHLRLTRRGV